MLALEFSQTVKSKVCIVSMESIYIKMNFVAKSSFIDLVLFAVNSISLTEVKYGCIRSETGWATF